MNIVLFEILVTLYDDHIGVFNDIGFKKDFDLPVSVVVGKTASLLGANKG